MARSPKYDRWEDAGLALTDDELAAFDLEAWCLNHAEEMQDHVRVLLRRSQIPNVSKPEWTKKAAKVLQDKMTWFVVAAGLPAVDLEALQALPEPRTQDGKALTVQAQALEPVDWLPMVRNEVESEVRRLVTMMRRLPTPPKAERSIGNKVVNALERELDGFDHLEALLASLPKAGDGT